MQWTPFQEKLTLKVFQDGLRIFLYHIGA